MPMCRNAISAVAALAMLIVVAVPAAASDDALMMERLSSFPKQRPWPMSWFQPQEPVHGAAVVSLPRLATGDLSIPKEALDAAMAYAEEMESTSLIIIRDGRIELAKYWNDGGPGTIVNSYYFNTTAMVLLFGIAVEEGHIKSIDQPAADYLPEWRTDARRAITIRQLLQMSSGLEMYFDNIDPASMHTRAFFGSDIATAALEYPLEKPPGSEFAYNYIVPEVLGVILERATGQRYAQYLSTRLWQPLGNQTAYVWLDRPGGKAHQNSGLYATPHDWANFGQLLLDRGSFLGRQLVPEWWFDEMLSPSPANPNYGFIWLGREYVAERLMEPRVRYRPKSSEAYLAGDLFFVDGYGGQRIYVVPSERLVIVRFGKVQRDAWDDSRLPNIVLRGLAAR